MAQQLEETRFVSIWSKDDILKNLAFKERAKTDEELVWRHLLTYHEWGTWLLEKKREVRHGKFLIQLQVLGEQIDYSYEKLARFMKFARRFPDFAKFKSEHPEGAPSWTQIIRDFLYNSDTPKDSEGGETESYERWVLNWAQTNLEKRAWLYKIAPQVCQKLHMTKSEALEEGLILLCEREGFMLPANLREEIRPSWKLS